MENNIGFIGYSQNDFDEEKARNKIKLIFEKIVKLYPNCNIISGATNIGIPKIVYEEAKKHNLYTIGIMCKKGYDFELFHCDEIYAVGDNWGDESDCLIDNIDILYKIGGGKQSETEIELAKLNYKQTYEIFL